MTDKANGAQRKDTRNPENRPIWQPQRSQHGRPLKSDIQVDVCIVGAGIAGMTAAYLLAREGKRVAVLEKHRLGAGETGRTTAHLSNVLDASYRHLERVHGAQGTRLAAESHAFAIDQIESIVRHERIDCAFERLDGYLFLAPGDSRKTLRQEWEAAQRAGVQVEQLERPPFDLPLGPCLRFARQGQFDPSRYISGLTRAFERMGGQLYTETEATQIESKPRPKVTTQRKAAVTADTLIVATNTPVNDWVKIHTKQAAYRSYAVALRVPAGSIPRALYWDTENPFHYVRVHSSASAMGEKPQDMLIVGGEDHKTGQEGPSNRRFERLARWAQANFQNIGEIEYQWSGQIMESMDGLAFIGRNPGENNVYIATGDSGNGMTHGTIAGMLLRDAILGIKNRWAALYDPSRKTVRATLTFVKENANVAAEYAQWLTPGEVSTAEEIGPGTGAIVRRGLSKVAVYRDGGGQIHEFSAVCPHLGCIVGWNPVEHTWDCPCHGSRFDCHGGVLNGPALGPLEKVRTETPTR
jgi:glycine/D-amino acid oxidase-like deaminating enzyme/nitrite reductase/ring-hydroxylating ferredoxin subunit